MRKCNWSYFCWSSYNVNIISYRKTTFQNRVVLTIGAIIAEIADLAVFLKVSFFWYNTQQTPTPPPIYIFILCYN